MYVQIIENKLALINKYLCSLTLLGGIDKSTSLHLLEDILL